MGRMLQHSSPGAGLKLGRRLSCPRSRATVCGEVLFHKPAGKELVNEAVGEGGPGPAQPCAVKRSPTKLLPKSSSTKL